MLLVSNINTNTMALVDEAKSSTNIRAEENESIEATMAANSMVLRFIPMF
jgi:hypothetical protein